MFMCKQAHTDCGFFASICPIGVSGGEKKKKGRKKCALLPNDQQGEPFLPHVLKYVRPLPREKVVEEGIRLISP